jgi:glycosyltransferase involved in cell wall biosynthesis
MAEPVWVSPGIVQWTHNCSPQGGTIWKILPIMRILIVNVLYPPRIFGGAEKSVALLGESLVRAGHEVFVLTLHPETETTDTMINGVNVRSVPIDNAYWPYEKIEHRPLDAKLRWHIKDMWNSQAGTRLERYIDIVRPDVMHTNNIRGFSVALWQVANRAGIPIVHTLRDYSLECAWGGMFRKGRNCESRCAECRVLSVTRKFMSSRVQMVVGNSRFTLDSHLAAGYFRGVGNDVIFNIGGQGPAATATPLDDGPLVFGYIGRIEPMKGIEVLLTAMQGLTSGDARLVIAGAGEDAYVAQLKQQFGDPRISWLGFVKANDFYSQIDVCVVPSLWNEPLPRGLLETFTAGKSAIYAETGGSGEAAALGRVARGYRAADAKALRAVMSEALDNPAHWRRGGFASEAARAIVGEDHVVQRYIGAYERAIAAAPARSPALAG